MSGTLSLGSHGKEVSIVQEALNRQVAPALTVDGSYGQKTRDAVRRFQLKTGFTGAQVDGKVGPKTTVALFQLYDMHISATLTTKTDASSNSAAIKPANTPAASPPKPTGVPNPPKAPEPEKIPQRYVLSPLLGLQGSKRDGPGMQLNLGLTVRSRNYLPRSPKKSIYHSLHTEFIFQHTVGLPLPPSSIYTGQLNILVQPVTDWLVLGGWHLLTPSVGVFAQTPLNPNGGSDPSNHSRIGFTVGLEAFHYDIIDDHLSIGVAGQESGYLDIRNRHFYGDPSLLVFVNGSFNLGPKAK